MSFLPFSRPVPSPCGTINAISTSDDSMLFTCFLDCFGDQMSDTSSPVPFIPPLSPNSSIDMLSNVNSSSPAPRTRVDELACVYATTI
jgi:hypothetical protein